MDIQTLKSQHSIVNIIGNTVNLKKQGHAYSGLCPFHADSIPSLKVYPNQQSFHCFGCGEHGDIISWIEKSLRVDFKTALSILGGLPERTSEPFFKKQPKRFRFISQDAAQYWHDKLGRRRTYFHNRGFTDNTVDRELFGFDGRRYTIPLWTGIPQESRLAAVKLRRDDEGEIRRLEENGLAGDTLRNALNLIPRYVLRGSYEPVLYNSHMVENENEIWIFFGELDAALASQFRLPACSPTHGANGWARDWGRTYLRYTQRINIFPDKGEEEQGFRVRAILGGHATVKHFPDGPWKDFTDFILAGNHADDLRTL